MSEPGNWQGRVPPLVRLPGSPLQEERAMDEQEGFHVPEETCFLMLDVGPNGEPSDDSKMVAMRNDRDELTLPIFTDRDLAERFAADSDDIPDVIGINTFDTLEKLADLLDTAQSNGIANVVFDPVKSSGLNPRSWPIAYAAHCVRNRLDLR